MRAHARITARFPDPDTERQLIVLHHVSAEWLAETIDRVLTEGATLLRISLRESTA